MVVFKPTGIHNGAVRYDNRLAEIFSTNDLKRAEGFSETHFCIPEKFIVALLLEEIDGAIDCVKLFVAKIYLRALFSLRMIFFEADKFFAALDGFNRGNGIGQRDFEPFASGGAFDSFFLNARTIQNVMNVAVAESFAAVGEGKLGVQKIVLNARRPRVSVDSFFRGGFQVFAVKSCLADFQQVAVRFQSRYLENINQFLLSDLITHLRPPPKRFLNVSGCFFFQSIILQKISPCGAVLSPNKSIFGFVFA